MKFVKLAVFLLPIGCFEAKVGPGSCRAVSTKLDFDPSLVMRFGFINTIKMHRIRISAIKFEQNNCVLLTIFLV